MADRQSSGGRVVVEIRRDLAELIPGYLQNRHADIQSIQAALDRADFSGVAMLGHSMKGSGAGYGFPRISEIGARIEQAAAGCDAEGIHIQLAALNDYLDLVEIVFV